MYQIAPNTMAITISDMDLMLKLSKDSAFTTRPRNMYAHLDKIPKQFTAINGKEWRDRRKLFYNSMLKITDSILRAVFEYFTIHVRYRQQIQFIYTSTNNNSIEIL